jgi:predicted alpha/beta superfamily hydrolase
MIGLWPALLLLFAPPATPAPRAKAEEPPPPVTLPRTEVRLLRARSGIAYKLYVSTPPNYARTGRYPVVYLLDADYSFAVAKNITDHLTQRNHLPDVLVVAIGYDGVQTYPDVYRTNRTRDYTPTHSLEGGYGLEIQKHSGGGPAFRDFLRGELFPFVEKEYATDGRRVLVGHSYGGLFASWVLLTSPELFGSYLVVSPSLWYDQHLMLRLVDGVPREGRPPAKVFMSVGTLEGSQQAMLNDLRRLHDALATRQVQGLALKLVPLDDETHNSVFPAALGKGLRWIFDSP